MARKKVNEKAFQKAEAVHKTANPGVAKTRGVKPSLLARNDNAGPFRWLRLQPISKVHAPVRAWARRTATGWEGWLEQVKKASATLPPKFMMPTQWSADVWQEVADLKEAG